MKITLSKSQWEGIGKKAGWTKSAEEMSFEEERARKSGDLGEFDEMPSKPSKLSKPITHGDINNIFIWIHNLPNIYEKNRVLTYLKQRIEFELKDLKP